MSRRNWRRTFFGILLVMACNLFLAASPVPAQNPATDQSGTTVTQQQSETVDAQVGGMTDEQVRQAYAQKLREETVTKNSSKPHQPR